MRTRVLRIGPDVTPDEAHGEFIGLAMLSGAGVEALRSVHAELAEQRAEGLERSSLTHIFQAMIDRGHAVIAVVFIGFATLAVAAAFLDLMAIRH